MRILLVAIQQRNLRQGHDHFESQLEDLRAEQRLGNPFESQMTRAWFCRRKGLSR